MKGYQQQRQNQIAESKPMIISPSSNKENDAPPKFDALGSNESKGCGSIGKPIYRIGNGFSTNSDKGKSLYRFGNICSSFRLGGADGIVEDPLKLCHSSNFDQPSSLSILLDRVNTDGHNNHSGGNLLSTPPIHYHKMACKHHHPQNNHHCCHQSFAGNNNCPQH